jgi:hydrogenase-4 component F
MTITLLIFLPVLAGLAALIVRSERVRRLLLPVTALSHSALTASAWVSAPGPVWGGLLALDPLGLLFLSITSVLFLAASFYCVGYLEREDRGERKDFEEGVLFSNAPEAVFVACLLFFLGAMSAVTVCQHFALLWIGVEATTLASAPLIYFHRHRRSLEATWKYLMICSVGIALALMGYLLMAISASFSGADTPMVVADLVRQGPRLHVEWLKAAFILFLVGYGTKMGLAPLHTWLPDAHSEAPSIVSALLSGALLNCAFLGILRAFQVCQAAGEGAFVRELLVFFGLFSMAVAAVFILGQADFKRMLAYSSVEHMGILALGVGLGSAATFGAMLHAVNHSLTKGMLFLVAGNILAVYRTKSSNDVRGVLKVVPVSGALWVLGFFAITGSPPFGPFLSEFAVLKGALDDGRYAVAAAYLVILAIIFVGMASAVLRMSQGTPPEARTGGRVREMDLAVYPPVFLAVAVTVLGVYVPQGLQELLKGAARSLGGL